MSTDAKKVFFIINRKSGTGYQSAVEGRILDECRLHDALCTLEFTQYRGHATELARQAVAEKFDLVVAVGGDGTMNEVAQGLINTSVAMGIVPRGSGNGLARHLGIPLQIKRAVRTLFVGSTLNMDTFTVNNRLSLNVSGIGFDGHIARQFDTSPQRGLANYARITWQEYLQFPEFEATLTTHDHALTNKAFIIAIANSSQYGNNACIAPLASVCDQKLHICIVKKIPAYRADVAVALFARQAHRSKFCTTLETDALTISLPQPMAYHIDGEPGGEDSQFAIQLNPRALTVLIPSLNRHKV